MMSTAWPRWSDLWSQALDIYQSDKAELEIGLSARLGCCRSSREGRYEQLLLESLPCLREYVVLSHRLTAKGTELQLHKAGTVEWFVQPCHLECSTKTQSLLLGRLVALGGYASYRSRVA